MLDSSVGGPRRMRGMWRRRGVRLIFLHSSRLSMMMRSGGWVKACL